MESSVSHRFLGDIEPGRPPASWATLEAKETRNAGFMVGALAFVLLGVVLPLTTVHHIRFDELTTDVAYALTVYAAVRISVLLVRGRPRLMACAFWTFSYSFLSLPLLAQITERQYPLATAYSFDDSTFAAIEVLIVIGFVGYEFGCAIAHRRSDGNANLATLSAPGSVSSVGISTARAAVTGYIGLVFVTITVARYGIAALFTSRDALTQIFQGPAPVGVKFYLSGDKTAGLVKQILNQVLVFTGGYLLLYKRHALRHVSDAVRPSWLLITPLLVGNVLINNPVSNARFWYGTVVIAFVTIYLPVRTRRWAAKLFIVIFVGVSLFSFHQLAAFRRTGVTDLSKTPLSQSLTADPDFGSPEQMLNGIAWAEQHGYQFGKQLSGSVLVWLPRSAGRANRAILAS